MKSDISSESLKRNLSLIRFVYNLIVACSKEVRENYLRTAFELKNKKTQIKIKP